MASASSTIPVEPPREYVPRGPSVLTHIFHDHFESFADSCDELYGKDYGRFRLERISRVVERFGSCGDYSRGVARIKCTNPRCKAEYFRPLGDSWSKTCENPFSCSVFHLCPSCSQKRTLLLGEYMNERLLLRLPHRQFVFTLPLGVSMA